MTNQPDSSELPDRLDEALAALWAGSSDALDQLVGGADDDGGKIGRALGVSASAVVQDLNRPKEIGEFEILGELGRGGMGIVYEARQWHPERLVALKVIRGADLVDEQRVRLFQREVQTLARLRHPNIAALYEAGETADGRHFFVMELIVGVPLTEFASKAMGGAVPSPATFPLLLSVFCRVCDAISYAHQRGVIHRDLKPSNILVNPEPPSGARSDSLPIVPEVKVLDFGLARVTDSDVATVTMVTDTARLKGTLPYMSPEQLQGDPDLIDIRCDVYALGVVLYQLLTGRLPFEAKRRSVTETMRAIREEFPPRPGSVNRALRGDLETIILKAIERDPGRRYQSAAALGEDVVRLLGNQPILARPPSAAYQLRKLIARHRVGVGAVGAFLLVCLAAAAVSSVALVKARAAERFANEQRLTAEAVNRFLVDTFSHIDPRKAQNRDTTLLRELLADAAVRADTELSDQPLVRSTLDIVIGQAHLSLGVYEQAEPYFVRALSTRREVLGPEHLTTLEAMAHLGTLRADQGRLREAVTLHETVLEVRRRVLGEDHPDTLTSMNDVGNLFREQDRLVEAEKLLAAALKGRRAVLGDEHPDTLISINNLSNVFTLQKKYGLAEKLLRESLAAQRKRLPEDHLDVLVSKNDLAMTLKSIGRIEEAESLFREVAGGFQKQLGEGHMDTLIVLYNLEAALRGQQTPSQAAAAMLDLTTKADAHLPAGHHLQGAFRSTYARWLLEAGRAADAVPHAIRAFEELKSALGPSHIQTKMAADNVADIYESLGRPESAAPYRKFLKGG